MSFVIPPAEVPSVAIDGSGDLFPVHRVYCIGRNYLAHVREMGNDERQPPFFFQKPTDALVPDGGGFPYPPGSENVQHEVELVVAIGKGGTDIAVKDALDHVFGYAVGFDMTRRDLQEKAKKGGKPWEAAKAFDHAAPISSIKPASDIGHPTDSRIWLAVNDEVRQDSTLDLQIWNVAEGIAHLSKLFEVKPGDLIFTGTPAGVGAIKPGDVMSGGIDGIGALEITVVD
ncbi:MAG: fumarylacetoacetate hydrolase family protein [Rhodospirillales bacterium]|nr:fumarylacetoacetate hydrolase family protein [Rhodospirillales bacterium]